MSVDSPDSHQTIYRSIFLSDIHLGTRGSRAALAADFLKSASCEKLYLVGDIIDGWRLRRSWFWDEAHDELLRLILKMARRGTEVIYIPGNHDEMFRRWLPMDLKIASIRLCDRAEHIAADGRRYLVMHGDEFDSVVRCAPLLAILGDHAYTFALFLNRWINVVRRRLGLPYRSFSRWAKKQVKGAVKAIDRFEHALAREARQHGADGVICGHIHNAEIRDIDGITYMNTGDWVESCTALVEDKRGAFSLVEWSQLMRASWGEGSAWFRQAPTAPHGKSADPAAILARALAHVDADPDADAAPETGIATRPGRASLPA